MKNVYLLCGAAVMLSLGCVASEPAPVERTFKDAVTGETIRIDSPPEANYVLGLSLEDRSNWTYRPLARPLGESTIEEIVAAPVMTLEKAPVHGSLRCGDTPSDFGEVVGRFSKEMATAAPADAARQKVILHHLEGAALVEIPESLIPADWEAVMTLAVTELEIEPGEGGGGVSCGCDADGGRCRKGTWGDYCVNKCTGFCNMSW